MSATMRFTLLLFAMVAALCCATPAGASTSAVDALTAVRAPHPLPLDPALSDPAWQAGRIDLKPGLADLTTRHDPPAATVAYVLYDDRALYVAFHASQVGIPIAANQTTNGVGFGIDDFVGIGVDPGGSGSQVYYFETTPRGTRYQQASENARYAPGWSSAARITAEGWDAVLVIPLAALRLHGGAQHWRINLIRQLAATGDHLTWAFDGIMNDGPIGAGWPNFPDARFWPALGGFRLTSAVGTAHTPRADVYGLASAGRDRTQFQQADQSFQTARVRNFGIDFAVPLTDTVTFVGTAAPDFSNVEVDQVTNAPQEFRRQLLEYRPFFAQGAAFLNPSQGPIGGVVTPVNTIFYTPGIGPFDRGAKIEGTAGNNSFGVLSVRGYDQTRAESFDDIAYGYTHALPNRTLQYWADGVLAHHSAAGSDETSEVGFKARNLHTGFILMADTAVEHGTALGGAAHSSNGFIDIHKPNYELNLAYADVSPHYGPLDGFTTTSDIRGPSATVYLLGNGTRVKNWFVSLYGDRYLDGSGAVHEADTLVAVNATFKNGLSLNNVGPQTGVLRSYDIPAGTGCTGAAVGRTTYTGAPCYRNGRTDPFDLFNVGLGYRDGTPAPLDANYTFGPFGGDALHLFSVTTSRPLAGRLALTLEYDGTWERSYATGLLNSQWLRRVGLGASLGRDSNVAVSLRSINGTGGFALPGTNVAASFHRHWTNGNELYVDFGTPAATQTLDRFITKYVFHVGPLPGT
jgi:hypothetical protein